MTTTYIKAPDSLALQGVQLPRSRAVDEYFQMQQRYMEWWPWITGEAINELDKTVKTSSGDYPEKYPLKLNPIQWVVQKHSEILWGETPDNASSLVTFNFRKMDKTTDEMCEKVSDFINLVWTENNGAELQSRGGFHSQFLGGCVYKVAWDPTNERLQTRIRLEEIPVDVFIPIPDGSNPWVLLECYIMKYISPEDAYAKFGIRPIEGTYQVLYVEHWTRDKYEILVDGKIPTMNVKGVDIVQSGPNPWGRPPFVYIPHYTRPSGFYGISHVSSLVGLTKELNARSADMGDLVQTQSGNFRWIRNSTRQKAVDLPDGTQIIDIGQRIPGGADPETGLVEPPKVTGAAHEQLLDDLLGYTKWDSAVPGVAWGEDEGSQRSAMTLAFRMYPLTSHIKRERNMFTIGLNEINRLILELAAAKIPDMRLLGKDFGITEEALNLFPVIKWYPMTPRDRLDLVNEVTVRKSVGLISRKRALEMFSDGEDIIEEMKLIEEDMKQEQELAVKAKQAEAQVGATAAKATTKEAVE